LLRRRRSRPPEVRAAREEGGGRAALLLPSPGGRGRKRWGELAAGRAGAVLAAPTRPDPVAAKEREEARCPTPGPALGAGRVRGPLGALALRI